MNELESLKADIQKYNNECIRLQTLIDQARNVCDELEQKYNISSIDEFKKLVEDAKQDYENSLQEAKQLLQTNNEVLVQVQEICNG